MVDVFVGRLIALSGTAKEQMATAYKTSNHTVSVRSAFDLPPAQRSAIETAAKEAFAPDAQVQFETAPELVSGIELTTNGYKIAWSIADYLATLENSAGELLHKDAKPEPKPDAKPKTEPKAEARPVPKREHKNGPVPVAAAPKADH
jgi:F-type H+-transporting ATPase subunit b